MQCKMVKIGFWQSIFHQGVHSSYNIKKMNSFTIISFFIFCGFVTLKDTSSLMNTKQFKLFKG